MKMQDYLILDNQIVSQVYARDPLVISGGEGVFLYDIDGKKYYDFSAHYSSSSLGHNHPELIKGIIKQLSTLVSVSAQFATRERVALAKRLLLLSGENYKKVLFGVTGSDAIEFALKAAKYCKKGGVIVSFWRGYHGATAGSAAATGKAETIQIDPSITSLLPSGFVHVSPPYCYRCDYKKEYPLCDLFCIDFIKKRIINDGYDNIAAIITEPIQAAGGVIVPPPGYLKALKKLCRELDALLIFDEVVTGFGRIGSFFASQHWDVYPDIMVVGKALTGGYIPGSAVLMTSEVGEAMDKLTLHGHTHSAYPLMCASALTNLDIIENERLPDNAKRVGNMIIKRLQKMMGKYSFIGDIRGVGLLIAIEIVQDHDSRQADYQMADKLYSKLREAGIITELESFPRLESSVIVLHPPLILSEKEACEALDIIERVFNEIKGVCGVRS